VIELILSPCGKRQKSKLPKKLHNIINITLMEYPEGTGMIFDSDINEIYMDGAPEKTIIEISADWYRPFKERTAVFSGHREGLLHIIPDGCRNQYNHYRSNKALNGHAPGQEAGVSFQYSHGHLESLI
jgi:hypothetical protein